MAVKMNLWSLTLLPEEKYPMLIPRDFQITNCALGEELRDESGRSVVKVTHNPIPPSAFDEDSDEYDSELDSELDDEMMDEFGLNGDDDDEEEDDEEEEEAPAAKKGAKVNGTAKALKAALAAAEEDDDDDEEESEDDEDFSDDEEEVQETNVMCSLIAGKIEQAVLNLTFIEGEVVMFEVTGKNAVHLMGNYIDQGEDDSDSDSEYDDYSDLYNSEDDDEDLEDIDGPTIEELDEMPTFKKPAAALLEKPSKKAVKAEKPAAVKEETKAPKRKAEDLGDVSMASTTDGMTKSQKKKLAKKAKTEESAPATKESKPEVVSSKASQKVRK